MGIASSINSSINDGSYNNSDYHNDIMDDFIRNERQKALLSQSSSFLHNQSQLQPSIQESTTIVPLTSSSSSSSFMHHVLNDDDDNNEIDEYCGDEINLWLKIVGLHPHIADMTSTLLSFREIYSPQELYDEWMINTSIFESLECLNSNDISDILNSKLFRRNIANEQLSIQQSRDDIIQQMEDRCKQIQNVEQGLIQEMIQRQIVMDSMKEEMIAREIAREEQTRRTREETQMEMMDILEAAMGMSSSIHGTTTTDPYHSFDMNGYRQEYQSFSDLLDRACDLNNPLLNLNNDSPTREPNDRRSNTKEIIEKWDLRMSSQLLDFSSDAKSAVRRGNVGTFPAVFVAGGTTNICISIKLDEYPKRMGIFSFGFALLSPQSKILTGLTGQDERIFGKSILSWGILDNRNSNSACEIWGNNQKCCSCRKLYEDDVVGFKLDILRGIATIYLNGSEIFTYQDIIKNEQFIFGSVLPIDHKITIVTRDIVDEPEPEALSLLRSRTESSIVTISNQSGRRNIVLPSPEEILSSSPLNSPVPPSRLLASTRSTRLQPRTITASSTTSQRIAAHVHPVPETIKKGEPILSVPPTDENSVSSSSSKMDESNLCCICLESPKSTVLLPCRHLCLCRICGDNDDIENCPICRSHIITRMTVFL